PQFAARIAEFAQTAVTGGNGLFGFLQAVRGHRTMRLALGQLLAQRVDAALQFAQLGRLRGARILRAGAAERDPQQAGETKPGQHDPLTWLCPDWQPRRWRPGWRPRRRDSSA